MRAPIRRVVVLVCIEVTGRIGGQNTARLGDRPIRPLHGIGEHQLRAVGLQQFLPFGVGVRGNAESYPVAAGCADHGIRDPSVPGSGIEDHLPVIELAAPLSFIEDADGRPVLDRAARVRPLGFAIKLDSSGDLDQRSVSDQSKNGRS